MTNKNVEKLVRDHYCLRDYDSVRVVFEAMIGKREEYTATDHILQGSIDYIRESRVVIKNDKIAICEVLEEYSI